jgi:hypothetical protein
MQESTKTYLLEKKMLLSSRKLQESRVSGTGVKEQILEQNKKCSLISLSLRKGLSSVPGTEDEDQIYISYYITI